MLHVATTIGEFTLIISSRLFYLALSRNLGNDGFLMWQPQTAYPSLVMLSVVSNMLTIMVNSCRVDKFAPP